MSNKKIFLYFALGVAAAATIGSFYFSEILGLVPCLLCWYQRIAMWPLVLLLGLAIYQRNDSLVVPALVLSIIGLAVSIYQNWLYFTIIPDSLAPCAVGAPCSEHLLKLFGFWDIPQMSLIAFVFIIVSLAIYLKSN